MEKEFKQKIRNYLDNRAQTDELFAKAYAKPNKNIDECLAYIVGEAREMGNEVYVSDEVVYGWAVHYYDEDDIKINPLPKGVKAAASVELTEADKEKARELAIEQYKQQCIENLRKAEEERARKEEEKRKARIAKRKEQEKFAPSLFDF